MNLSMKKFCHVFAALLPLLLVSACGQTGPLYLPDEEPPIHVPKQSDEEQ